jgi:outer membrane protein OmpA-like peptidoglycan-associated protein
MASFQITFDFASARLTSDAHHILDLVGKAMAAPDASANRFRIVGHTDAVGTEDRNQHLSEQRADAVKAYLAARYRIDPARLETAGRGARDPVNRGDPTAAENRRVVITNLGG